MNKKTHSENGADEMQIRYAEILHRIATAGLGFLIISFFLYVSGIPSPLVPPEKVPELWHMEAAAFVEKNNLPTKWEWISSLGRGDVLAFSSLAFLASGTILCFIITLFAFLKRKEYIYSVIIAAEILVLVLAAAGIAGGGN